VHGGLQPLASILLARAGDGVRHAGVDGIHLAGRRARRGERRGILAYAIVEMCLLEQSRHLRDSLPRCWIPHLFQARHKAVDRQLATGVAQPIQRDLVRQRHAGTRVPVDHVAHHDIANVRLQQRHTLGAAAALRPRKTALNQIPIKSGFQRTSHRRSNGTCKREVVRIWKIDAIK